MRGLPCRYGEPVISAALVSEAAAGSRQMMSLKAAASTTVSLVADAHRLVPVTTKSEPLALVDA